jgi:hypothetical protein
MKIVDMAQEIYFELGQPSDLSVPAISYWLRNNIGILNNRLNKDIVINDSTLELDPNLGEAEKSIYKKIYECYFFDLKIKQTLNSINNDSLLEVTDGGGTVRRINRNETSKIYLDAKKTALNELTMMITDYNVNDAGPLQVAGDDTVAGSFITDKYFSIRPFNRV